MAHVRGKSGVTVERRQIEAQPIKSLGEHKVRIRLTVDLVPEVKVIVYREGEAPSGATTITETAPATEAVA